MAKDFPGIPYASLPEPTAPDFTFRLRNMLSAVDVWARDQSAGMARIGQGQVPSGAGGASGGGVLGVTDHGALSGLGDDDHAQYLNLTGRTGGQTLQSSDNARTILTIKGLAGQSAFLSVTDFSVSTSTNLTSTTVGVNGPTTTMSMTTDTIAHTNSISTAVMRLQAGAVDLCATGGAPLSVLDAATNTDTVRCTSRNATNKPLNIIGAISQSANLTEWRSSAPAVLASVSSAGVMKATFAGSFGTVPVVGSAASAAGILGTIVLTAQTGSLAAQTMLTGGAGTAGAYRLSFYLTTTTTGDVADNVTLTLAWNDGAAQTMVVGFLGTTSNIVPYIAHDLRTANAFSEATCVVRVAASTNVTFTTTLTSPGAGTPAYSIDARIEALG